MKLLKKDTKKTFEVEPLNDKPSKASKIKGLRESKTQKNTNAKRKKIRKVFEEDKTYPAIPVEASMTTYKNINKSAMIEKS